MAALGGLAHPGALRVWWLAARPRTLAVGIAPVVVGSALAWQHGSARPGLAFAALAVALLLQAAANLANDAFDHERGADGSDRVGPPRASAMGWLAPGALKRATALVLALAAVPGVWLILAGGWPIALAGALSLAAAVAYTGGPWPLGYRGLGDLCVFVFFGGVAVCGTYWVQARALPGVVVWAAAAVGALATAVLVVNNLRDLASDARAGKRTLAVRLGARATRVEYALLLAWPFAWTPAFVSQVGTPALLTLLALPRAWRLWRALECEPSGPGLNGVLAGTAQLCLGWSALFALGAVAAGLLA